MDVACPCPPLAAGPAPGRRGGRGALLLSVALAWLAGCGDDIAGGNTMQVYSAVLERQKQLIQDAFASIDPDALAHKRAFRDQVVRHMRETYGLEVESMAGPGARATGDELGTFLIFAARSDVLPRGYYQPGVSLYQQFGFADLDTALAFIDERLALGENVYLRAAPASAAELGERLVFSEYPDIAMTAFHEALHNRIQLPLAVEEPLHTLLALALTEELAGSLPDATDAERRLRRWIEEGAQELRQRFAESAMRYRALLATLDAAGPDGEVINRYGLELLSAFRDSDGSDAQQRHGRADAPPYRTPFLVRDLRVASLEPAEQGLIGTALLADYSTYERRFAEVYELTAPYLVPGQLAGVLAALLDYTVPTEERWSFDEEAENRALAWLAGALESASAARLRPPERTW